MRTLLLAIVPITLLLAACSEGDTTVVSGPQETTGISVTGRGEVQAPSDTGYFDVGVQVTAKTVAEARDGAAKAADAVISSLKKNGIDEKDIKTTGLSIQPQYEYPRNGGQPRITGYMVTNTVNVKVRKLDSFSKVLDDAVAAGGDAVRIQSIYFGIEDNEKLLQQAREAAMKDAKAKAEQLAKLGGVALGKPLMITESESTPPTPRLAAEAKGLADVAQPTPIEPGTGSVVVQVSVRWGFGD